MNETSIPLSHIQVWLSILGLFITVAITAAGAAWAGVKLALKPINKEIEVIKESRKERELRIVALENKSVSIDAIKESGKDRENRIVSLEGRIFPAEPHNRMVTMEMCETCQTECVKRNTDHFIEIKEIMRSQEKTLCDIQKAMAWFEGYRAKERMDSGGGR